MDDPLTFEKQKNEEKKQATRITNLGNLYQNTGKDNIYTDIDFIKKIYKFNIGIIKT